MLLVIQIIYARLIKDNNIMNNMINKIYIHKKQLKIMKGFRNKKKFI